MFDTGTSVGDIIGHSKPVNAVSVRRQRPFRAATGSDDFGIGFHEGRNKSSSDTELDLMVSDLGVPFKYKSVSFVAISGVPRAILSRIAFLGN